MSAMDLQDRAQYLSLALFSQKIVLALMEYVDEDKSEKLKPSLNEALIWLHSTQTKRQTSSSQRKALAYEHLRTLDEVWSSRDRANAIRMTQAVIRAPRNPKTKSVANNLIDLFSKLQDQALWNFEQPKPVSQKVMQRLCQMA
jgi:hypothetical protein